MSRCCSACRSNDPSSDWFSLRIHQKDNNVDVIHLHGECVKCIQCCCPVEGGSSFYTVHLDGQKRNQQASTNHLPSVRLYCRTHRPKSSASVGQTDLAPLLKHSTLSRPKFTGRRLPKGRKPPSADSTGDESADRVSEPGQDSAAETRQTPAAGASESADSTPGAAADGQPPVELPELDAVLLAAKIPGPAHEKCLQVFRRLGATTVAKVADLTRTDLSNTGLSSKQQSSLLKSVKRALKEQKKKEKLDRKREKKEAKRRQKLQSKLPPRSEIEERVRAYLLAQPDHQATTMSIMSEFAELMDQIEAADPDADVVDIFRAVAERGPNRTWRLLPDHPDHSTGVEESPAALARKSNDSVADASGVSNELSAVGQTTALLSKSASPAPKPDPGVGLADPVDNELEDDEKQLDSFYCHHKQDIDSFMGSFGLMNATTELHRLLGFGRSSDQFSPNAVVIGLASRCRFQSSGRRTARSAADFRLLEQFKKAETLASGGSSAMSSTDGEGKSGEGELTRSGSSSNKKRRGLLRGTLSRRRKHKAAAACAARASMSSSVANSHAGSGTAASAADSTVVPLSLQVCDGALFVTKEAIHFVPYRLLNILMSTESDACESNDDFDDGIVSALTSLPFDWIVAMKPVQDRRIAVFLDSDDATGTAVMSAIADRDSLFELTNELWINRRDEELLRQYKLSAVQAEVEFDQLTEDTDGGPSGTLVQTGEERFSSEALAELDTARSIFRLHASERVLLVCQCTLRHRILDGDGASDGNNPVALSRRGPVSRSHSVAQWKGTLFVTSGHFCFMSAATGRSENVPKYTVSAPWKDFSSVSTRTVQSFAGILESYCIELASPRAKMGSPIPNLNELDLLFPQTATSVFSLTKIEKNLFDTAETLRSAWFAASGNRAVFGAPINRLPVDADQNPGVPELLVALGDRIRALVDDEGLFRLSAASTDVTRIRAALDGGAAVQSCITESLDSATVCALFKELLRSLPDPITTFDAYPCFMAIDASPIELGGGDQSAPKRSGSSKPSKGSKKRQAAQQSLSDADSCAAVLDSVASALKMIPAIQLTTLRYVCRLLSFVAEHKSKNRMDSTNLATVFGPVLFRQRDGGDYPLVSEATLQTRSTAPSSLSSMAALAASELSTASEFFENSRQAVTLARILIDHHETLFQKAVGDLSDGVAVGSGKGSATVEGAPGKGAGKQKDGGARGDSFVIGYKNECTMCKGTVFPRETVLADGFIYHRLCFRCSVCSERLRADAYVALEIPSSEVSPASNSDQQDGNGAGDGDVDHQQLAASTASTLSDSPPQTLLYCQSESCWSQHPGYEEIQENVG